MGRPRKTPATEPARRRRGSGSVGTRKDGRVFATLPPDLDHGRRPHYGPGGRARFADEAAASAWLAGAVARLRNPGGAAHAGEPLGAYLRRWLESYGAAMAPRTLRAYKVALKLWLPHLGAVALGDLTHERIQGAIARLQEARWQRRRRDGTPTGEARPYSARTLSHARTVLGAALAVLVPEVLAANPCRRTRLPRRQRKAEPVWDAAEADRFLDSAERLVPHLALAYRLVLRRGLRRGELVALRWANVRVAQGILVVEETAGARAGTSGPTKGRRRREIPIGADLVLRLETRRTKQPAPSPWVFTNPDTGKPYALPSISAHIKRIAGDAGVPPISLKDMRATCATALLDEGVALVRVSRLLGHASVAVTAAFYERQLAARDGRITRVADQLDEAWARASAAAADTGHDTLPTPLVQPAQ